MVSATRHLSAILCIGATASGRYRRYYSTTTIERPVSSCKKIWRELRGRSTSTEVGA